MSNQFTELQAQSFSLAGAGAVIGDTTLVLKAMTTIDGALITMSMLGSYAFMTLEPGNGTSEEQIKFTGITQNANGTATLTGVSNISFGTPYTVTSGLLKTHAGSVTAVLSNTSGFYNSLVAKDDDSTLTGTLTFTTPNFPQMNNATMPTLAAQLATKGYADSLTYSGAPNASSSVKGIVQLATRAQYDAGTLIGSTSAALVVTPDMLKSYLVDSGSPNVLIITPSPAIASYVAGQQFSVKALYANTSPTVSINVNGIGAKSITLNNTASPNIGDIVSNGITTIEYDGTNFQILSSIYAPSGTISMFGGATAPTGYLLCDGSSYSRTVYLSLFGVIGTTFGNVDGSHFNVPNLGGRFVAGPSAYLSTSIGAIGGNASPSVTLSGGTGATTSVGANGANYLFGFSSSNPTLTVTGSASVIPPYMILNYIIKY